ncbi:hypothetical protein HID58_058004 [Brassica napus]|uniref:Uncharacterized protein n=1 Tax=Brassica napus TaxID=3708 RepID=A0ABQ7ZP67_BRANA|nr:hypothetical protein HID58_058004 [Brassica napus]
MISRNGFCSSNLLKEKDFTKMVLQDLLHKPSCSSSCQRLYWTMLNRFKPSSCSQVFFEDGKKMSFGQPLGASSGVFLCRHISSSSSSCKPEEWSIKIDAFGDIVEGLVPEKSVEAMSTTIDGCSSAAAVENFSSPSESVNGTNAGRKSLAEDKGPDVPADVPAAVPADASSSEDKAPEPSLSESVNGTNAGRKSLAEDKGPDVPADVPAAVPADASSSEDKAPEPSLLV